MKNVVIIGNGVAGITAARHIRKRSDDRITVIGSETRHFFSRTALMYIYMGHMTYEQTKPYEDWFWKKNRIDLVHDHVMHIDTGEKKLHLASDGTLSYDSLIIATGSLPNKFGWSGQDLRGVQGLYSMQDLEAMERNTAGIDRAVIVGGGLIGIEMAEMLRSRGIDVTFLVREESYWNNILPPEESAMVNRHIRDHGIHLRLSTELDAILPDDNGGVRAVRTGGGDELSCQFVGLTAGVHPNIAVCRGSGIATERGVLVNSFFEANLRDVYAIGDCAEFVATDGEKSHVEQLWYTARMHGEALAAILYGERKAYDRGILFNSAKFLDIEYQTYGEVPAKLEGLQSLYWEHPGGTRAIRIVYDEGSVVRGFNLMGIRYRHRVCEQWITEERTVPHVLRQLGASNFDPEFSRQFERELVASWNAQHPEQALHLRRGRGLRLRRALSPKRSSEGASA
ncbi:MAG: FAD-dependent oxidoreductase [Bacteroidota bacterium]|nr:FAD-dependent oxidoreductase [Bacteroidota bacterium]